VTNYSFYYQTTADVVYYVDGVPASVASGTLIDPRTDIYRALASVPGMLTLTATPLPTPTGPVEQPPARRVPTTASEVAPAHPELWDRWLDTTSNLESYWDGAAWVALGGNTGPTTAGTVVFDPTGRTYATGTNSQAAINELDTALAAEASARSTAVSSEATARAAADTALSASVASITYARTTVVHTTASLAANAQELSTVSLPAGYRILAVRTSVPARVRLYCTSAQQTADAARRAGADPAAGTGVMLDYVTTASLGTSAAADLSPVVDGVDFTGTPGSGVVPLTVDNTGLTTTAITVTLTYIRTE
jgi:hypothetical protein